jgi:hypothetical protein
MPHYRIILLERSGRIFSGRGAVFADDEAALVRASADAFMFRLPAEVWCGSRLVANPSSVVTVPPVAHQPTSHRQAAAQTAPGTCCAAVA